MSKKWLFFDIGSTLVDESECYQKRCEDIVRESSVSIEEFQKKMEEFAREKKSAFIATAKYYDLPVPGWHSELEVLYPDAEDVLSVLSKRYNIGIIANQALGSKERLQKFGILQYIQLVTASAEEGVSKPDLEIFRIALQRAGCKPAHAFMIGDRLDNDIIPAKEVGMRTIWVRQGFAKYQFADNENEIPDVQVDSLKELKEILG